MTPPHNNSIMTTLLYHTRRISCVLFSHHCTGGEGTGIDGALGGDQVSKAAARTTVPELSTTITGNSCKMEKKMTIHRHICMHVHVYLKTSHFSYNCMFPSNSLFANLEVNKFYCLNTTCTHTQPLTDNIPSAVYNGCICDSCNVKNRIICIYTCNQIVPIFRLNVRELLSKESEHT